MKRDGYLVGCRPTTSGRGVILLFMLETGRMVQVGMSMVDRPMLVSPLDPRNLAWYPLRCTPTGGKWYRWTIDWKAL